jgi:hypothetical protein
MGGALDYLIIIGCVLLMTSPPFLEALSIAYPIKEKGSITLLDVTAAAYAFLITAFNSSISFLNFTSLSFMTLIALSCNLIVSSFLLTLSSISLKRLSILLC